MNRYINIALMSFALASSHAFTSPASAQQANPAAVSAARRQLEVAKHRLLMFVQIEWPQRMKQLDSAVDFETANVESLKKMLAEYQQFTKFKYSQPLLADIQETKLLLLAAEQKLDLLRDERALTVRFRGDQIRQYELAVEDAQEQVKSLESRK